MSCRCSIRPGSKRCHCRKCCLTFSGPWAFDRHIMRGQHVPPHERGLRENGQGIWGRPADLTARNFLEIVRPS